MSIFRNTFTAEVENQLNKRQKALQKRSANDIIYLNSRNSWVRMTSGVNVGGTNDLAKDYVMLGGVLNSRADKSLRSGVGTSDKAYANLSPSTNSYNSSTRTAGTAGLKPMPGITSVDVKSKSAYGSLREVTVNFSCNNLQQLEDLELLYMRPGYTVLVEWGFSPYLDKAGDIKNSFNFYDKVLEGTATIDQIFKDLFELSRKYDGNYEGHYGYVKNYNWSARADGGYDCQTTILSVGELMESLVTSWTPMNVAELAKDGLVAPTETIKIPKSDLYGFANQNQSTFDPMQFANVTFLDIGGEVAKRGQNYSKSILTGILYELYRYCFDSIQKARFNFVSYPKPKGKTDYHLFAYKTATPPSSDSIVDGGVEAYITLESFVRLLNKHVVTAISNKQYQNIKPFTELSVFPNTYDPANANTTGSLLCLAHPLQVSVDPSVCLITSPIWAGGVTFTNIGSDKSKSTKSLSEIPILKALGKDGQDFRYKKDYGNELGNIGNIYLNINRLHQLSTDPRLITSDQELKLYDFLKTILKEVQTSIGSVNTFDIHVDPVDSVARIIDFNYVDDKKRPVKAFQIEVANLNSTVRSYSLQSQIFPNQSNLIALGAQLDGAGNQSSQNATLIDFNKDVEDRIVPKKLPSVSGKYTNVNDANNVADANALKAVKANISTSIEKIGELLVPNASAQPSTTVTNQGSPTPTSSNDYKSSLSNLIRYFQGITNSTTKNRGIIPVKISLTMDGIGGLIIGHLFKIPADLLPRGYKFTDGSTSKLLQIITGISHKISDGDWTTTIDALNIIATEPTDETTFSMLLTVSGNQTTVNVGANLLADLEISGDYRNRAFAFIASKEQFTEVATDDEGKPRLGYGTDKILDNGQLRDVRVGDKTTPEAAKQLLLSQIQNDYEKRVIRDIGQSNFDKLNANQKAALISYAYNVGSVTSGIVTAIKQGKLDEAATQIQNGPTTGQQSGVLQGLILRREQEAALFLTPVSEPPSKFSLTQPPPNLKKPPAFNPNSFTGQ
jgi:GH24 family phage-related lysozyme (muramidase)